MFLEKENAPEKRFFYNSSRYSYLKGGKSDIFYNNKYYIVNVKPKEAKATKIPTSFQSKLLGMYDPDKIKELQKTTGELKRMSSKGFLYKSRDKPFKEEGFKQSAYIGSPDVKVNNHSVNFNKSFNVLISDQINNNNSIYMPTSNHNENKKNSLKKSSSSLNIISPKIENSVTLKPIDNFNNTKNKNLVKSYSQNKLINKSELGNSLIKISNEEIISPKFQHRKTQSITIKVKECNLKVPSKLEVKNYDERSLSSKKGIYTYKKNESINIFSYNHINSKINKKKNKQKVFTSYDLNQFINV